MFPECDDVSIINQNEDKPHKSFFDDIHFKN